MRRIAALSLLLLPLMALAAGTGGWVRLPGGNFRSALKYEDRSLVRTAPFQLMETAVTNADFLAFVKKHPKWQRGRAAAVFADCRASNHWPGYPPDVVQVQLPGWYLNQIDEEY